MKKQNTSLSINVLSVLVILMCVLLTSINPTNAWFSAEQKDGVLVEIQLGELKLNLYQKIGVSETRVYTYAENAKPQTATKSYIVLNGVIEPDKPVDLNLIIKNEDTGSASMYIRFRFEVYARGVLADQKINSVISGFTTPSIEIDDVHSGFVYDEETDYYYYKDSTQTSNVTLNKNNVATLMTSFTIPYEEFMDDDGNMKITNSDSLYIKLFIDASVNKNFAI